MGGRQIVLVSTAEFSVLNTGIFWREAKTKRLFSQCGVRFSLQAMETEEVPMDTEEDNTEICETMKQFLAAAGNHFSHAIYLINVSHLKIKKLGRLNMFAENFSFLFPFRKCAEFHEV